MYASLSHIRAEGVTEHDADDARALEALQTATGVIDRACGWFFEPREQTFALSGRGGPTLEVPVPPVSIKAVRIGTETFGPGAFDIVGAPVGPSFFMPKLVRRRGVFPKGRLNVCVQGVFGYTVASADDAGGCPPSPIKRATLLLACRLLQRAANDDNAIRSPWRLIEERTRDQSYRLEPVEAGELTGDPDVDALLRPYRRPFAMGAA